VLLTDPLDDDSRALLGIVHHGSGSGSGDWPVWQWVRLQAAQHGLDADGLVTRLPQWLLHYRPVTGLSLGGIPQDGDRLGLTVHGLTQVDDQLLLPAFLGGLAVAAEWAAHHVTTPQVVTPLEVNGEVLTARMQQRGGSRVMPERLRALLEAEPATWAGHSTREGQWFWDLTGPRLAPFAGVTTAEDYLQRLDTHLVGIPAAPPAPGLPPEPLALLDALDHLSAEWRIRTGDRLVEIRRTVNAGVLTQPVDSAAELERACSAFADLLAGLDPRCTDPAVKGTLNQLDHRLGELLTDPERRAEARAAVQTLRHAVNIRAGQQHSGTDGRQRAQAARRAMGLPPVSIDWQGDWDVIRRVLVDALRTLRQHIAASDEPAE